MKFKTPCYVRVEDAEKRKELIKWLGKIGHKTVYRISVDIHIIAVGSFGTKGMTDCGTNIDLFRALAAMNDENDHMQWFISGEIMFLCENYARANCGDYIHYLHHAENPHEHPRKATAKEIINHFKR